VTFQPLGLFSPYDIHQASRNYDIWDPLPLYIFQNFLSTQNCKFTAFIVHKHQGSKLCPKHVVYTVPSDKGRY